MGSLPIVDEKSSQKPRKRRPCCIEGCHRACSAPTTRTCAVHFGQAPALWTSPNVSIEGIVLPEKADPIILEWIRDGKVVVRQTGCWEWMRCRNKDGYGQVNIGRRMQLSHRVVIGGLGSDLDTCHSCDNPPCCNPWHLFLGTRHTNTLDMKAKGRGLRIGRSPRCKCGKAMARTGSDCDECRAVRLDKPMCRCGVRSRTQGLCSRCYQQRKRGTRP